MSEWFWFFCVQTGCGGDEFGGAIRLYSLIIEFGDDDIVRNLKVVTDKRPCSKDKALCYANGELRLTPGFGTANKIYRDESPNASASDGKLQALRGEETARYSATLESGITIDLVERRGLVFDMRSMEPFTGRITRRFDENVGTFSYKAGLLHGPVTVWDGEGSVLLEACFEDGAVLLSAEGNCAL